MASCRNNAADADIRFGEVCPTYSIPAVLPGILDNVPIPPTVESAIKLLDGVVYTESTKAGTRSLTASGELLMRQVQAIQHVIKEQFGPNPKAGPLKYIVAIALYSWQVMFHVVNSLLRSNNRSEESLTPILPYLKLLIVGLRQLPPEYLYQGESKTVYRSEYRVHPEFAERYEAGRTFTFYGFSSCTTQMKVLPVFGAGDAGQSRTVYELTVSHGYRVKAFSMDQGEEEVLLEPCTSFEVVHCRNYDDPKQVEFAKTTNSWNDSMRGLHVIIARQVPSGYQLLTPDLKDPLPQAIPDLPRLGSAKSPALTPPSASSETKLEKLLGLARQGDVNMQFQIGESYEKGDSELKLKQDWAEAAKWYGRAAAQGHPRAQSCLADSLWYGLGLPRDRHQAKVWYRKAADQREPYAMGVCSQHGLGVYQSWAEAASWYGVAAAEQSHARAQSCLGDCYWYGLGVPKDEVQAKRWFRQAAALNNNTNLQRDVYSLGRCLLHGIGVTEDKRQAVAWFFQAASEQAGAPAQNALGLCYEQGLGGLMIDSHEAARWYRSAADQGYAPGQYNLALCYAKGVGGVSPGPNCEEAVKWYRAAADQGLVNAQHNLGNCYERGSGVPRNLVEARKWWSKAAEQGHQNATLILQKTAAK